MYFDFSTIPGEARDKLLHSTVVPRPIAWVSSLHSSGAPNLAPFSFFNMFCASPPIIGLGIGKRASGDPKHTARNILETKEFVVNLVSHADKDRMNMTGADVDDEIDEAALAGIEMIESRLVKPRRVACSVVSMECVLHERVELAPSHNLILGRVLAMHIADEYIEDVERHYIHTPKMDLLGRMHGSGWYARTTDLFRMPRATAANLPSVPDGHSN